MTLVIHSIPIPIRHSNMGGSRILEWGGDVLTSGRSDVNKGPKTLYNVGRFGGGYGPDVEIVVARGHDVPSRISGWQ